MSRPVLAALFLLLSPAYVFAQGADTPAPAEQQDPKAAYQALVKEFNKAIADWRKEAMAAVQAAQKEGKPMPAIAMRPPTKKYIDRAGELAKEHAGEDVAVSYLAFVCKYANDEGEAVKSAIKTLTMDHAESEAIAEALPFVGAGVQHGAKDDVMALLEEVITNNASTAVKAKALIQRGTLRLQMAENDADRKAASTDLNRVAEVTDDAELKKEAKDALFEIEHLQVGCAAPDIVAKDVDGVDFKLSDYRGKVVLLDFWGFW